MALLPETVLGGSVTSHGKGALKELLYNPAKGNYEVKGKWNEYGVLTYHNLGKIGSSNPFFWQASWPTLKNINYLTFAGTYPNQPQQHTMWRIRYRVNGVWTTLASGQGGWINSGIYQWGGEQQTPFVADAVRVEAYSDGTHDIVSIHLRARGGVSINENDSAQNIKATLIQYI